MNSQLTGQPRGKVLWLLFYHFFKIALFVVGGGYAILLAAEEIFVKRLHWLKDGELMDMLAIIQTIPGLLAGNAAIYVGYRAAGRLGALVALTGVALPSFLVIYAVSFVLRQFSDLAVVQYAFNGIRAGVLALLLKALLSMYRQSPKGAVSYAVMAGAFVLTAFCGVDAVLVILASATVGLLSARMAKRRAV